MMKPKTTLKTKEKREKERKAHMPAGEAAPGCHLRGVLPDKNIEIV